MIDLRSRPCNYSYIQSWKKNGKTCTYYSLLESDGGRCTFHEIAVDIGDIKKENPVKGEIFQLGEKTYKIELYSS